MLAGNLWMLLAICSLVHGDESTLGESGERGPNCAGSSCRFPIPRPKGQKGEPGLENHFTEGDLQSIEALLGKIDILPIIAMREKGLTDHKEDSIADRLEQSIPSVQSMIYREKNPGMSSFQTKTIRLPQVNANLNEDDKLWMLAPLVLGKSMRFPHSGEFRQPGTYEKKVFLAAYPYPMQGGEMRGWAQAEKMCRDAGWSYFRDGGFRALLTTSNLRFSRILPKYLHHLKVVNLAGEPIANSWTSFIYGQLVDNRTRIITMTGHTDEILQRWNWKYYWMGDGQKRTCADWSSSYMMDVADVWAMNSRRARIFRDVASCSTQLHLMCYSVCDEHDRLL